MTAKPKRILVVKEHHGAMAYSHRFPDFSGYSNRICTTKKSTIEWFHFVLFTIMFIYFGSSCSVYNSLSSFIPAILMTAYRLRLVLIVILDQVLIAESLP